MAPGMIVEGDVVAVHGYWTDDRSRIVTEAYSSSAAGITTLMYVDDGSARDGAITDADIELNGVNFAISVNGQSDGPPGACLADLQNTLTHELGHLI